MSPADLGDLGTSMLIVLVAVSVSGVLGTLGHELGHLVLATLHANNATAGLTRLSALVSMSKEAPRDIESLIAEAVDVIVHIARTQAGRIVREIIQVTGYDRAKQKYELCTR